MISSQNVSPPSICRSKGRQKTWYTHCGAKNRFLDWKSVGATEADCLSFVLSFSNKMWVLQLATTGNRFSIVDLELNMLREVFFLFAEEQVWTRLEFLQICAYRLSSHFSLVYFEKNGQNGHVVFRCTHMVINKNVVSYYTDWFEYRK